MKMLMKSGHKSTLIRQWSSTAFLFAGGKEKVPDDPGRQQDSANCYNDLSTIHSKSSQITFNRAF